jgi:hypothetical protein
MKKISLVSLQTRLKNYYLPYELAETIPLYSNFHVDQTLTSSELMSMESFHENYYTLQQLLRIEKNLNVFHSIILSDKQYSLLESYETIQKNEGSIVFVLLYYIISFFLIYGLVSFKCEI